MNTTVHQESLQAKNQTSDICVTDYMYMSVTNGTLSVIYFTDKIFQCYFLSMFNVQLTLFLFNLH